MKAGHKFIVGAGIIVLSVALLIAQGVGLKMGAKVVPGSVRRDPANRQIDFQVSDGLRTYPVTYRGLVPDTFTDANDIEVIVEGKYGRDGVFRATEVLAKCGSRYEAELEKSKKA